MGMAVVKVWKCDSCGKLMEKKSEVYVLDLKSLPFKVMGDPEARDEVNIVELHFCKKCAMDILNSLKRIEDMLRGKVGRVSS